MKKYLITMSLLYSITSIACPDLKGIYRQVDCSGDEPSTVLSIPKTGSLFNGLSTIRNSQDKIVIDQRGCEYDISLNGVSKGTIMEQDWSKPYAQSSNKLKIKISKNNIVIKSGPAYSPIFNDRKYKNIKISKTADNDLIIKSKTTDIWHLGVYPVIEVWNASCRFERESLL
jgi:hypothetical protein